MQLPPWQESNTLSRASLVLGILSIALVFGDGLCVLAGANQGWLGLAATPLYVCGASSAFLGFLAAVLGGVGLFGKQASRSIAVVGLLLGLAGICMFVFVLKQVGG